MNTKLEKWEAERAMEASLLKDPVERDRFVEETNRLKPHLSLWMKIYEFDKKGLQ